MKDETYPNAPLALVAFEVRYPEANDLTTSSFLERLKELVSDSLPLREDLKEQEMVMMLGAEQQPAIRAATVPRFTSRDRNTVCQVRPAGLIVETTSYSGFQDFRSLIRILVEAVADVRKPDGVTRIGLRYIDEIRVPEITDPPGNWHDYIADYLLAPVAEELVRAAGLVPRTWQGIVQYETGQDRAVVLRYGPMEGYAVPPHGPTRRRNAPQPGLFFLLDSDSYWKPENEVPEFDPKLILEVCDELHVPVKALFNAVLTNKLRDEVFRRERKEASSQ